MPENLAAHPATVIAAGDGTAPPPPGKRFPFGWRAFALAPNGPPPLLKWPAAAPTNAPGADDARLRVTVGLDEREEKRVAIVLAQSGRTIGALDIRYASFLQPFEVRLRSADANAALQEGVVLQMTAGTKPLYLLHDGTTETPLPPSFAPHLLIASKGGANTLAPFYARLFSLASTQPFGWIEGCVLDGLLHLGEAARPTLLQHLRLFFTPDEHLDYEGPQSAPLRDALYGMEAALPFAIVAAVWPRHPRLDTAVDFLLARRDGENAIVDRDVTTAEGSYIAAYPLAAIAKAQNRPDLADLALAQLRIRQKRLMDGEGNIYQRVKTGEKPAAYRNWGRGVAWYLLGLARTLPLVKNPPDDLVAECGRAGEWALRHQRADGLWSCYLDEPQTGADTSGSAGIAAALALLASRNWLSSPNAVAAARRALSALTQHYLTPDGFLGGSAQLNKGGEALQRGGYRVLSPMAMGLMAQLIAALPDERDRQ